MSLFLLIVSLLYCCVLFGDCLDVIECSLLLLLSNVGLLVLPSCVELGARVILEFDVDRIKLVGGAFMFVFDPRRIDFRFGLCGSGEFEFVLDLMDLTDLAVLLTLMVGDDGRAVVDSSETTESFLDVDEDVAGGGGISVIFYYHPTCCNH